MTNPQAYPTLQGSCELLSSCVPQKYALMGSPLSPLSGNIIKSGNRDCPSSVGTRYCGQDCQICYGKLKKTDNRIYG